MEETFDVEPDTQSSAMPIAGIQATADAHNPIRGVYANDDWADEHGETVYTADGDSSDEIDPRLLYRDPTLSELRWYYRRTFMSTIVDKPILDAFKNGYDVTGDTADTATDLLDEPEWEGDGDGFDGAHIYAEQKARRDGFSVLFIGTEERNTTGLGGSPINEDTIVEDITHFKVFTIDDLSGSASTQAHEDIKDAFNLERSDYEVRQTGIVVNRDPTSRDFDSPIGYILDTNPSQFIHRDRTLHYAWNRTVDGDYGDEHDDSYLYGDRWVGRNSTLGQWEGDSVMLASYDLIKGVSKGNWSVMQALFRQASHMYTIELPEDADENDLTAAVQQAQTINSKSALVTPHGYDINQEDSGNEMDPQAFFGPIFDQICAVHEMTKSVLFGTQSGTVSGSETDIKNYFNKVERYRSNLAEQKIGEYLTLAKRMQDGRTNRDYEFEGYEIEWGPLFKLDAENRITTFQSHAQSLTTLIGQYVLTPDEARSILSEEWAEVDLENLTDRQLDELDRIRLATSGQGTQAIMSEEEYESGPQVREGEGAGRPEGARQQSGAEGATPNVDSVAEVLADDEFANRVAEKVADRITDQQ